MNESLKRALKSMFVMPTCQLSLMIVTKAYIDDYYNGEADIVTQVRLSKQLSQPVILMLDQDLTPNEKKQVDNIFQNHKVVAKIRFDRNNIRKSEPELFEALKPYGAKKPRR